MPRRLPLDYYIVDGETALHDGDMGEGRYALYHGDPETDGEMIALSHDEVELQKAAWQHDRDPKRLTAKDIAVLLVLAEDSMRKTKQIIKAMKDKDALAAYFESQELLIAKLRAYTTYDTDDFGTITVSVGGRGVAITG